MLCSLRQREVLAANIDSKNCTAVVTMTGASQFSQASRLRSAAGLSAPDGSSSRSA